MKYKSIFEEIEAENKRAEKKHFSPLLYPIVKKHKVFKGNNQRLFEEYELPSVHRARFLCDNAFKNKELSHINVILEELCEVVEAANGRSKSKLRKELIQLASTCLSAIRKHDNIK